MNTWLDARDKRYTERVRLLIEILPVLAQEPNFALKGGTAINLALRMPPTCPACTANCITWHSARRKNACRPVSNWKTC